MDVLSAVVGGLVTWGVTHVYDRRAMVRVPNWAHPLLERLPQTAPSREELRDLLLEVIEGLEFTLEEQAEAEDDEGDDSGETEECPKCGSDDLEVSEEEDENEEAFERVECLACGWEEERDLD